jgi:hypothetical protein
VQRRTLLAGRLRWLSGHGSDTERWDAYEAFAGQPLVAQLPIRESWANVRLWLNDLRRISRGFEDSTANGYRTDRVWITNGSRAVLLISQVQG